MLSKISIEVFAKTGDEAEIIYFFWGDVHRLEYIES